MRYAKSLKKQRMNISIIIIIFSELHDFKSYIERSNFCEKPVSLLHNNSNVLNVELKLKKKFKRVPGMVIELWTLCK